MHLSDPLCNLQMDHAGFETPPSIDTTTRKLAMSTPTSAKAVPVGAGYNATGMVDLTLPPSSSVCKSGCAQLSQESAVIGPSGGIGAEEMGMLVAGLGRCPSLAYLDLRCNSIRDEGVKSLYAWLGQCPSLTHLYLCNNDVQNKSMVLEQHDNLNRAITATQNRPRQSVLLQY